MQALSAAPMRVVIECGTRVAIVIEFDSVRVLYNQSDYYITVFLIQLSLVNNFYYKVKISQKNAVLQDC